MTSEVRRSRMLPMQNLNTSLDHPQTDSKFANSENISSKIEITIHQIPHSKISSTTTTTSTSSNFMGMAHSLTHKQTYYHDNISTEKREHEMIPPFNLEVKSSLKIYLLCREISKITRFRSVLIEMLLDPNSSQILSPGALLSDYGIKDRSHVYFQVKPDPNSTITEEERKKKIRYFKDRKRVKKKLREIRKLEERLQRGEILTNQQLLKIQRKSQYLTRIYGLKENLRNLELGLDTSSKGVRPQNCGVDACPDVTNSVDLDISTDSENFFSPRRGSPITRLSQIQQQQVSSIPPPQFHAQPLQNRPSPSFRKCYDVSPRFATVTTNTPTPTSQHSPTRNMCSPKRMMLRNSPRPHGLQSSQPPPPPVPIAPPPQFHPHATMPFPLPLPSIPLPDFTIPSTNGATTSNGTTSTKTAGTLCSNRHMIPGLIEQNLLEAKDRLTNVHEFFQIVRSGIFPRFPSLSEAEKLYYEQIAKEKFYRLGPTIQLRSCGAVRPSIPSPTKYVSPRLMGVGGSPVSVLSPARFGSPKLVSNSPPRHHQKPKLPQTQPQSQPQPQPQSAVKQQNPFSVENIKEDYSAMQPKITWSDAIVPSVGEKGFQIDQIANKPFRRPPQNTTTVKGGEVFGSPQRTCLNSDVLVDEKAPSDISPHKDWEKYFHCQKCGRYNEGRSAICVQCESPRVEMKS